MDGRRRSANLTSDDLRRRKAGGTPRAIRAGWSVPTAAPSGKRVLVVGAGPSGLSAGYHLAKLGHHVVLRMPAPSPEA